MVRGEDPRALVHILPGQGLTRRAGTEGHHGAPSEPANRRELTLVVAALFVTTLLAALDQTIFATALPTIVGDLNGVDQMLWVTTSYLLAATVTMPVYGKFGDLLGHKPLLLVALVLFLAGSVLGGLAGSMPVLIMARAVQGLGGGGMMILSQAIIADIIPPRRRGTYLGILGGAWAFASVLGPILGGWFVDTIGWRWAFWFNLPLGILAVVAVSAFLKTPERTKQAPRVDALGMATLAVVTTAVIFVASLGGREYAWGSPIVLGLLALAIVGSALFVVVERRAAEPIIPLLLFRDRNFNLVTAGGLLSSVAFLGVVIYMPSYLQMVSGLSATKSGLLFVPLTAGILIASVGSGARVSRTGRYRWMPAAGAFLTAVSLYLLSTLTIDTEVWTIGLYLFVCGLGTGIGFQILIVIVQNSFPSPSSAPLPAPTTSSGKWEPHARLGCRRHSVRQPASGPPERKAGHHRSGFRWSRRPELPHPIECRPDVGASEDGGHFFVQRRPRAGLLLCRPDDGGSLCIAPVRTGEAAGPHQRGGTTGRGRGFHVGTGRAETRVDSSQ